ncbi:ATP-dependent Clp protease proteolytic subunit, partial [Paraclostridium sordellii]|uniref:ATP-dependent Clp protease proteolytic subunit n=1 Tax=Paraclostridium sordellii TaxID=1505 RepID=UPI00138ACA23
FMNAQKAKELGFVDEIMVDTSNRLFNNTNESGMLPPDVIEKIRNMKDEIKLNPKKNTNTVDENSKEKEINN